MKDHLPPMRQSLGPFKTSGTEQWPPDKMAIQAVDSFVLLLLRLLPKGGENRRLLFRVQHMPAGGTEDFREKAPPDTAKR